MTISMSPIAFTIGDMAIRWYGIMVALAILVIILWMLWEVKKGVNLSSDTVLMAAIVGIPAGVIVSRLLHVIDNIIIARFHPELVLTGSVIDYLEHPGLIVGSSGLTIYGAVLGAALGIWIYSRFSSFKFGYFADVVAPAIILAQAIGRIGCTINGCCYGLGTSMFCGIVYTNPESYAPLGISVHPTQIYEIIYLLIVFGVVMLLRRRLQPEGSVFLVYMSLYAVWRIGIDFLREGSPFLLGLHQAQVIGIIVLLITVPLLAIKTRWARAESSV